MERAVELRHLLVGAVHGQGVLGQVVGADGEEVHDLSREVLGDQGRGWNLDHGADA